MILKKKGILSVDNANLGNICNASCSNNKGNK